jgi:hypothetical protein
LAGVVTDEQVDTGVEIGFIDKSSSVETFTDDLTLIKIGALIARGIHEYCIEVS